MRRDALPACPKCGKETGPYADYCPSCGASLPLSPLPAPSAPQETTRKNATLATLLSLVCPGLGQAYIGKTNRALTVMVVAVLLFFFSWILLWIPLIIFWIWNVRDANRQATQHNRELDNARSSP
jgi:TM2 domain-containing membrane protein YozV